MKTFQGGLDAGSRFGIGHGRHTDVHRPDGLLSAGKPQETDGKKQWNDPLHARENTNAIPLSTA